MRRSRAAARLSAPPHPRRSQIRPRVARSSRFPIISRSTGFDNSQIPPDFKSVPLPEDRWRRCRCTPLPARARRPPRGVRQSASTCRSPLRAGLPAVIGAVGLAVVEHIPLPVDVLHAAVGIAQHVEGIRRRAPLEPDVADGHQRAAAAIAAVGTVADRPAQFVAQDGGIDEVVLTLVFADGAGLEELVPLAA